MDYRREIDGLRALAVVPVILFHAGFSSFGGGFVGVDVFFVISGYLITSIILSAQQAGRFSLADFYERRARRILPALFLVMAACLLPAWWLLVPDDYALFSRSLVAVSFFASNFLFYKQSGYFDTSSEFSPLLHTWSLAVEEQYYLVFPLFMLLAWRLGRRAVVVLLLIAAIVSLVLAEWVVQRRPSLAFFMLPTRGWELLIGALLAFAPAAPRAPRWMREGAAITGMALIVGAIIGFDAATPFPGVHALVPTLGTALIIRFATPDTLTGRLLGLPLLVGIGLISYSAYLWHQPLLAFARHGFGGELPPLVILAAIVATFLLAWLTWRHVESPFRDRRRVSRRMLLIAGGSAAAFFTVVGIAGHATDGFDHRLTDAQRQVAAYGQYDVEARYRRGTCFLKSDKPGEFAPECAGEGTRAPLLVWGDSYAAALAAGLRAHEPGLAQYTGVGCPPVLGVDFAARPYCRARNEQVLDAIRARPASEVLLHGNWQLYARHESLDRLDETLARLRAAAPDARVTLVGVLPQWSPSLPILMIRADLALDGEHRLRVARYRERVAFDEQLRAIATRHGVHFRSALEALCEEDACLAVVRDGENFVPSAWDNGHLTEPAAVLLAARLRVAGMVVDELR